MKRTAFIVGGIAVAILLGYIFGRFGAKSARREPPTTRVDTLYIYDTVTISTPLYVEKRVVSRELVEVVDTLRLRDTLFVYLEREQVEWRDSLCTIWASGVHPAVDSVKHFQRQMVLTREVPVKVKSHWGVGVQVGYGATVVDKSVKVAPYIGVGVSWNFLSW